jgi:hypothetical protein
MTYPQAQFLLTVHYQLHCPVCIGAWEGCHQVYTAATLVEALKPSPFLPYVPRNAMDDVGFLKKNCQDCRNEKCQIYTRVFQEYQG